VPLIIIPLNASGAKILSYNSRLSFLLFFKTTVLLEPGWIGESSCLHWINDLVSNRWAIEFFAECAIDYCFGIG